MPCYCSGLPVMLRIGGDVVEFVKLFSTQQRNIRLGRHIHKY